MVAVTLMWPQSVTGQDTPFDPRTAARVHLGVVHLTPRLTLNGLGLDTNVFNSADERRDFTVTVTPHVDVWLPFGGRALVTSTTSAPVVYYQTYASERSINPATSVRGDFFVGRFSPFVEAAYSYSHQRPNFEIDARVAHQERAVRTGLTITISPMMALELAAKWSDLHYDEDALYHGVRLEDTLGSDARGAAVTVRQALTPLTSLVVLTEIENRHFILSPQRNSDTLQVRPGLEFKPTALIAGSAYVGVRRFMPDSASIPPFNGVVANAALSYSLLYETRFEAAVDRDVSYSYQYAQPYFVIGTYGATIRRQLIREFDLTAGFQWSTSAYRDLVLPAVPPSEAQRLDITRTWLLSLGYRVGQTARIGVGGTYQKRTSNTLINRDYEGLRLGITLGYERLP